MPYAFKFNAWDKDDTTDDDGYRSSKKNSVYVTVKAEDEQGAEEAAKALVVREQFKLNDVIELTEELMPIGE